MEDGAEGQSWLHHKSRDCRVIITQPLVYLMAAPPGEGGNERASPFSFYPLSLSLPFLFRGRISSLPVPSSLLGVTLALKWDLGDPVFSGAHATPASNRAAYLFLGVGGVYLSRRLCQFLG